jgi:hypothetical protein
MVRLVLLFNKEFGFERYNAMLLYSNDVCQFEIGNVIGSGIFNGNVFGNFIFNGNVSEVCGNAFYSLILIYETYHYKRCG